MKFNEEDQDYIDYIKKLKFGDLIIIGSANYFYGVIFKEFDISKNVLRFYNLTDSSYDRLKCDLTKTKKTYNASISSWQFNKDSKTRPGQKCFIYKKKEYFPGETYPSEYLPSIGYMSGDWIRAKRVVKSDINTVNAFKRSYQRDLQDFIDLLKENGYTNS